jgi:P-type Ca2+ transporter type 2C
MNWFQSDPTEVLAELDVSSATGLDEAEARERLGAYGRNELQAARRVNPLKLFITQFNDALIIVLLAAAVVSFGLAFVEQGGSIKESVLIFAIVFAIALVGFFNEYKAEKTVEALTKLVGYRAKVRRSGRLIEVETGELVPGDIVLLEAGQKIPADLRVLEASELMANESSLTGESLPVSKNTKVIKGQAALGDQKCLLFAGTFITSGSGTGVVVETGQKTEIGKIANLVSGVEAEATPMQQKLDNLGKRLGYFIAGICAVVFVVIFLVVPEVRNAPLAHRLIVAFTAAVALAVAAIPEGLAFVVRISLALGARRMAGKNALVRRLSAVEALGSTDTICSDKTGTLTKGEMTVRALYVNGQKGSVSGSGYGSEGSIEFSHKQPPDLTRLLEVGVLCNNSVLRDAAILGDPTEGALLVTAAKSAVNADQLTAQYPRLSEIPFSSESKRMSTVHTMPDGTYMVASKGAVEMILKHCSHYLDKNGKHQKLTPDVVKSILQTNVDYAGQALRVLAFAYKIAAKQPTRHADIENDLVFVGLQAMMDPPRTEVIEVIHRVQAEAGMRVIMITGDYIETAKAVAHEIGLPGDAISGSDLDNLSQKEFEERVEHISVYARVNPEHKIRIVQALKKHGHQVAMTGDGVNDAPAIKAADIGIAMGITGTDVSKEAADLILLDDQFNTIVAAIEEGRGIFDNVRKFVNFLISCNIAEVITIVMGIFLFNELLLTAAQLLFINIVTDGMPAVALGSDPARKNVLQAKPGRFQEAIVSRRVWAEILIFGTLMSVLLVGQFWYNHTHEGRVAAVSAAFAAMVVYELVRLIDIRTDYKIKWFSNPWLSVALVSSFILQLLVLYFEPLARYFGVGPLSGHDWLIMLAGSILLIIIMKALNPLLDRLMVSQETSATALR